MDSFLLFFAKIHPKYKTPWISTLLTGVMVGIPSLFMNLTEVTDLTSIGTLFAFVLVCGGVLRLNPRGHSPESIQQNPNKFITPYINSRYIFPTLMLLAFFGILHFQPETLQNFFSLADLQNGRITFWELVRIKIPLAVYLVGTIVLTVPLRAI
jgi:amino acid transporter